LIRYSHSDLQPLKGLNFYRLKIVDEDGKYTYSKTISVLTSTTTNHIAGLYPNPASDKLMVDLNLIKAERASIQVIDMTGRVISDRSAVLKAGLNNLEFDIHSIAKGQYMVRVSLSSGVLVRKFIKD
jgi:alcohol dehydrogenase YqhD (iron-dependent ADH family)